MQRFPTHIDIRPTLHLPSMNSFVPLQPDSFPPPISNTMAQALPQYVFFSIRSHALSMSPPRPEGLSVAARGFQAVY